MAGCGGPGSDADPGGGLTGEASARQRGAGQQDLALGEIHRGGAEVGHDVPAAGAGEVEHVSSGVLPVEVFGTLELVAQCEGASVEAEGRGRVGGLGAGGIVGEPGRLGQVGSVRAEAQ
ncbi:hypothetical protein SDC9_83228 [bioreactor metagenome]|uniref:Uncharacterized protein n=1 Tax=bioreactor metagenome TaxID=1076179 RepID=A0A644Z7L5_9ZZZZ